MGVKNFQLTLVNLQGWYYDGESQVKLEMTPIRETWEALEELHAQGLVKNIGISNFNSQAIFDIFTYAKVKPCMLQIGMLLLCFPVYAHRLLEQKLTTRVEHHPYLVQKSLVDFCEDQGILVTAYSSFGPLSFLDLPPSFPTKAAQTSPLFELPLINQLATKYSKSPSQILLRWAIQRGLCVIPKSMRKERMRENLDVTGFDMTQQELNEIAKLDLGLHFNDPGVYLPGRPIRLFT